MFPRQFSAFQSMLNHLAGLAIQQGASVYPGSQRPDPSGTFTAKLSGVSVSEVTVLDEILPPDPKRSSTACF